MDKINLKDKRILITGGGGFLGSYIIEELKRNGIPATQIFATRSEEYDLRDSESYEKAFKRFAPDVVIHAAAKVGGIGYNVKYPSAIFADNLRMALNILDLSVKYAVKKLTIVGSACMYPGELTGSFREDDLLNGPLHPTVEVYGFSKRALLLGARAYKREHGLNFSFAVPANMYGPGDTFDPDRSHVVSALIRKFVDAYQDGRGEVVCWGTGKAYREFVFVSDAAQAIVRLTELADCSDPVNVGTGKGTAIKELAEMIQGVVGYKGKTTWDSSRPDGAMHKVLDTSRMKKVLEWEPEVSLEEGLKKTIAWYSENRRRLGY